jgi:flagellar motor switch protein FliM
MLNATADSLVELRSGSISLTRGHMGRRNHAIAVRVEAPLTPHARQALKEIQ